MDCFKETLFMHNSKLYWVLKDKNHCWLSVNILEQDNEHPHLSDRRTPKHCLGIVRVISKYLEQMADTFKFIKA